MNKRWTTKECRFVVEIAVCLVMTVVMSLASLTRPIHYSSCSSLHGHALVHAHKDSANSEDKPDQWSVQVRDDTFVSPDESQSADPCPTCQTLLEVDDSFIVPQQRADFQAPVGHHLVISPFTANLYSLFSITVQSRAPPLSSTNC